VVTRENDVNGRTTSVGFAGSLLSDGSAVAVG